MAVPNPRVYVRVVVDTFILCADKIMLFNVIGAERFVVYVILILQRERYGVALPNKTTNLSVKVRTVLY